MHIDRNLRNAIVDIRRNGSFMKLAILYVDHITTMAIAWSGFHPYSVAYLTSILNNAYIYNDKKIGGFYSTIDLDTSI
ncbi:MAG: hypothetical protein QXJ56_02735 [Ignisphaera sp.]